MDTETVRLEIVVKSSENLSDSPVSIQQIREKSIYYLEEQGLSPEDATEAVKWLIQ